MSQTSLNLASIAGPESVTGPAIGGFFNSFFAAVRTARAIEAGVNPRAGDLTQLGIEPDVFSRIR